MANNDGWARAGAKVERWTPPHSSTDPTAQAGYSIGGEFTEIGTHRLAQQGCCRQS
jgi:hypothetical protein